MSRASVGNFAALFAIARIGEHFAMPVSAATKLAKIYPIRRIVDADYGYFKSTDELTTVTHRPPLALLRRAVAGAPPITVLKRTLWEGNVAVWSKLSVGKRSAIDREPMKLTNIEIA